MELALNSNFDSALLDCWEDATNGAEDLEEGDNSGGSNGNREGCGDDKGGGEGGGDGAAGQQRSGGDGNGNMAVQHHRFDRLPSWCGDDDNVAGYSRNSMNSSPADGDDDRNGNNDNAINNNNNNSKDDAVAAAAAAGGVQNRTTSAGVANAAGVVAPPAVSTDASINTANASSTSGSSGGGAGAGMAHQHHQHHHHHHHQHVSSNGNNNHQHHQQQQQQGHITFSNNTETSTQLHPLAIQASAKCPPHETTTAAAVGNHHHHHHHHPGGMSVNGGGIADFNAALLPLAMNAMAAGASLPLFVQQQQHNAGNSGGGGGQQQEQQQQMMMMMGNGSSSDDMMRAVLAPKSNAGQTHHHHHQQHGGGGGGIPSSVSGPSSNHNAASSSSTQTLHHHQQNQQTQQQQQNLQSAPPFLLFDAPVELRTNFQQAQRGHGLPVLYDNNAYHFGVAVNGFHPQNLQSQQAAAACQNVRLVDARHGDIGDKRVKNAKEQKRAQRIAELIDELRKEMEKGGWEVGHKSKFNTLSSCAHYVRHLVKVTKEKEVAVQQARNDLDAKRRKIEEDKAQQDPSDPESTTSSLTVSSSSAAGGDSKEGPTGVVSVGGEGHHSSKKGDKKRGQSSEEMQAGSDCAKKPRLRTHESSSSDDSGKRTPGVKSLAMDQTSSSISDITDSNKGSSSNSDMSPRRPSSGPSVSSDAAVVDDKDNAALEKEYAAVLVKKRKSQSLTDLASLAPDFEIDYEEVFVKSNVPQCLATTAGKIIAYNDFFTKATGLPKKRVENATIFSLVQTSRLSSLFEIVAKSLRSADPQQPAADGTDDKKGEEEEESDSAQQQEAVNYEAMTLPCIKFPKTEGPSQLYITVTLMPDEDPRRRCFHCLLTDCPCTDGDIGPITPELLSLLTLTAAKRAPKMSKATSETAMMKSIDS